MKHTIRQFICTTGQGTLRKSHRKTTGTLLPALAFVVVACGTGEDDSQDSGQAAVAAVDGARIMAADSEPGNWLTHGRSYDEQRHSPLTAINADNASKLGLAWYYDLDTKRGQEATPIVVDGRMFVSTAWSMVKALDAATGELLWAYDPQVPGTKAVEVCCDVVNRGVAIWGGRIYAGTRRGVQRTTAGELRMAPFAAAAGLAHDEIQAAFRDRHGDLWFGTLDGLWRLRPREDDGTDARPSVYIDEVRVDGRPWPVDDLGEVEVGTIELPPGGTHLQIDFFALPFVPGDPVRYEYRLDGADDRWVDAGTARRGTYANLAPGRSGFSVRAIDSSGAVAPRPAAVGLLVHPPV